MNIKCVGNAGFEPTTSSMSTRRSNPTELITHFCSWYIPACLFIICAHGGTRTPTPLRHHPLKMACLPVSPHVQHVITKNLHGLNLNFFP